MPNTLDVQVETPARILNAGAYGAGAIWRLQWSATQAGAFVDVSGTGSTPTGAIVAGTRIYEAYDPNGIVSTWYRTRYENVGATRLSDWQAAFQVAEEGAGLLCALWDVKQRLGIAASDTTDDENILEFIAQESAWIQGYTGRRFARTPSSGTTTFLFDVARTTKTLWVPTGIAEMSQLEVATQTGGAFVVVPTADWFLDPPATERDYGWPATRITLSDIPTGSVAYFYQGKLVVRATMAEGFASVPLNVQPIAQSLSAGAFRERGNSSGGDSFTIGPNGERTFERALSYKDRMTLDWYRVQSAG